MLAPLSFLVTFSVRLKYYFFIFFKKARLFFWKLPGRLLFRNGKWITVYGDKKLYVALDDTRAFRIAVLGGSQKEKINIWLQMAGFRPEIMLDIGANYGEFSIAASDLNIKTFAIEANPIVAGYLRKTAASVSNIEVYSFAVTDSEGEKEFIFNPHESGSASLARAGAAENSSNKKIKVKIRSIDAFLQERLGHYPKSFIAKIDVEGSEEGVLEGMRQVMGSSDWWYIMLEFNPPAIKKRGGDPNHLWEKIASFPGFVIERDNVSTDIQKQQFGLPRSSINIESDIVIRFSKPK